jgi:glycerol-3-phosphate cytidylyltransferase
MNVILSWEDAAELAQNCRKQGGVVVSTNGCFDILHKGHVSYLHFARSQGDLLLVGINSDASVRANKGPTRPVNDELSRAYVLAGLKSVDGVCLFSEPTPVEWLRAVRPQIHVKGGDWDPATMPETPVLASWGGRVVMAPYLDGFSTTSIIEKSKTL